MDFTVRKRSFEIRKGETEACFALLGPCIGPTLEGMGTKWKRISDMERIPCDTTLTGVSDEEAPARVVGASSSIGATDSGRPVGEFKMFFVCFLDRGVLSAYDLIAAVCRRCAVCVLL